MIPRRVVFRGPFTPAGTGESRSAADAASDHFRNTIPWLGDRRAELLVENLAFEPFESNEIMAARAFLDGIAMPGTLHLACRSGSYFKVLPREYGTVEGREGNGARGASASGTSSRGLCLVPMGMSGQDKIDLTPEIAGWLFADFANRENAARRAVELVEYLMMAGNLCDEFTHAGESPEVLLKVFRQERVPRLELNIEQNSIRADGCGILSMADFRKLGKFKFIADPGTFRIDSTILSTVLAKSRRM